MPSGAGQYRFVRVIPVLIFPGARSCVGFVLPAKRQVIPAPGAPVLNLPCPRGLTTPTAPTPALLSPDGAPARRLLMDGYVNEIRDDQDHPPWQEGRRASMDGVRRLDERDASPLAPVNRLSISSPHGLHLVFMSAYSIGLICWAESVKSRDERDMPAMSGGGFAMANPGRLPRPTTTTAPGGQLLAAGPAVQVACLATR